MYMRLPSPWTLPLALVALLSGTTGCSAPKSSAALPPQATPPTLKTTAAPAAKPESKPQTAPSTSIQPTSSQAPAPDAIDQLIAQVEKEYQKGQTNYQAGHLEAAKDNFDQAFDMLVKGKVSVQDDERLQDEFDKVVEAVHNLEMQALKEGDGFTEQKAEPAPIDEANEVTFPVDPNVRAKAEA